eukprot:1189914-Prorocentrum_minimum.AAC.2
MYFNAQAADVAEETEPDGKVQQHERLRTTRALGSVSRVESTAGSARIVQPGTVQTASRSREQSCGRAPWPCNMRLRVTGALAHPSRALSR